MNRRDIIEAFVFVLIATAAASICSCLLALVLWAVLS